MKILIFSADYGNGHKKVASYLASKYEKEGHTVKVINPTYEENKWVAKTSENIYSFISKNSKNKFIKNSYGIAFEMFSRQKGTIFSKFGERMINKEIADNNPDLVIFTFPYQPKNVKTKSATVITDYGFSKNWYNKSHSYIVGSEQIKKDLLDIDPTLNIYNIGIPIGEIIPKKKEILKKDDIENQIFLINLGALGICNIEQVKNLIKVLVSKKMNVEVICGKNDKLKIKLSEYVKQESFENIKIHGYVTNIKDIYLKTNIMYTKAGGVTITEAINYEIPLIIDEDNSMLGQEKMNIEFVNQENIGISLKDTEYEKIENVLNQIINDYLIKVENIRKIKNKYEYNQLEFKLEDI